MSATADIARYREYFKDLGTDERVEVLAIPSSPQHKIYERGVSYLEQVSFCHVTPPVHEVTPDRSAYIFFSVNGTTFLLLRNLY